MESVKRMAGLGAHQAWLARALLLGTLLLGACTRTPPEQRLREAMAGMQAAIEQRDAAALADHLAEDFVGPEGMDRDGARRITLEVAEESIQRRSIRYDKKSDDHYDHISAFIKSMRGSDPDAALYWMAKMLEAGEEPRFIARRILIAASEDVGNADFRALLVAEAAFRAVEVLGMPEARITLAQAVTFVASAPKSNAAYLAIDKASAEVREGPSREVPLPLRDANMDAKERGHGQGYKYAHDYKNHYVKQEYMPDPKIFYRPTEQGFEIEISKRLKRLRGEK